MRSMDVEGDRAFYERLVVDDEEVERGLASGELVSDTRAPRRARCPRGRRHAAPRSRAPSLAEDVAFAVEAQAMLEHDSWVKLTARAERLERRLGALERSPLAR